MDFFDTPTTKDCDICHKADDGTHTGHGFFDEVEQRYSFYLCPTCEAAEEKRIAEKKERERQEQAKRIAMY